MNGQGTLFEERFLGRYAGSIMSDPTIALVELVANAWDAYATKVAVTWPIIDPPTAFRIEDNGCGMTPDEFELRWRTLDYDRVTHQGANSYPPPDVIGPPRPVFGRNGKGRLAGFLFSSPYRVRTWRDGREATYIVSQGITDPIQFELVTVKDKVLSHGTEISAIDYMWTPVLPHEARSILSTRFLTNPNFQVSVNGVLVTFGDIPSDALREFDVDVIGFGQAHIMVIDTQRSDRTTRQHGIAWWVRRRLVGDCGWRASDHEKIIDGRTEVARRFTFIVQADFLTDAVQADWSDFRADHPTWQATEPVIQAAIRDVVSEFTRERREKTVEIVSSAHRAAVQRLSLIDRERWNLFLEELTARCPNLGETQIDQVMGLLANMEAAKSQYSLLEKLHSLTGDQIDDWNSVLERWTVNTAKLVLDEFERRARIIEEVRAYTTRPDTDEVHVLQPLFARALWIFGPQFESIEFTSNRGMTAVIKEIFKDTQVGSRNRPDFVITPDSSVGFYSRPLFDTEFNEVGVESLVIVELKRPGVRLGSDEKGQAWKYVTELIEKGYVTENTHVFAYVLGDSIRPTEARERWEGDRIVIRPLMYSAFIGQAEKRMMNLVHKLLEAPFMKEAASELYAKELEDKQAPLVKDLFSEIPSNIPSKVTTEGQITTAVRLMARGPAGS